MNYKYFLYGDFINFYTSKSILFVTGRYPIK